MPVKEDIVKQLEDAIKDEQKAVMEYVELSSLLEPFVGVEEASKVFAIAAQEAEHASILLNVLSKAKT